MGSKRDNILSAAEKIIAAKGLEKASISEIAREAGVNDSIIYHYFTNKEDLLFSVAGERLQVVLLTLERHLQGIPDPLSKMSKMIWFHLFNHEENPEYANLLLLECRSNKNFYKHEAHSYVRRYAGVLHAILEEGVQRGTFKPDLDIRIVRDVILGLLDWETLYFITGKETTQTVNDLDNILSILAPMICLPHHTAAEPVQNTRTRILGAAERAFAQGGYKQTTVSDIAALAGVAEGTLYDHFGSKEGILLALPEDRLKGYISEFEEAFQITNPLKKLRRLIRYHFFLFTTDMDFLKVFLLHFQLNRSFYFSDSFQLFQRYTELVYPILDEGKEMGIIRSDVNNRIFRNLFFGAFCHMAIRWFILQSGSAPNKLEEINSLVSLLVDAISVNETTTI